jgi:hypothetical protein
MSPPQRGSRVNVLWSTANGDWRKDCIMDNTFAIKYEVPTVRGTGFNRKLVAVREPGKTWREPKVGATVEAAIQYMLNHGYHMERRSHYNSAALKTVTEVWA